MKTVTGHHEGSVENNDADSCPLLEESSVNPLDKGSALIRNDLSQIKTLHRSYKQKIRRSKSDYHQRMKELLEYDTTKLVYILSTLLFVLLIALLVGLIYFRDSLFMYSVFISAVSAVFIMLTCFSAIVANSNRKGTKTFAKLQQTDESLNFWDYFLSLL